MVRNARSTTTSLLRAQFLATSVSRERRKKGDRRVALAHSYLRAGGAVVEAAGTALDNLLLGNGNNVGGDAVELWRALVNSIMQCG